MKEKRKDVTPGMYLGAIVQAVGVVVFFSVLIWKDLVPDASHLVVHGIVTLGILVSAIVFRTVRKDITWVWLTMGLLSVAWVALLIWWQFLEGKVTEVIMQKAAELAGSPHLPTGQSTPALFWFRGTARLGCRVTRLA